MSEPVPNLKSVVGRAAEIHDPDERRAFLDAACVGRPEFRAEVDDLLHALHRAGSFMAAPVTGPYVPATEEPGTSVGPYRLMEQIGEGGFGLVFVAEQQQPVRRLVALKILKPGVDTREVVARFEAERQALALMDHPNIARILDGGATDSGRPFFVMELVRGVPITEYCDQQRLTTRERLGLFNSVCRAVQHAHQKGVIHRDLKPSNVLVAPHDGVPVVKVIDFGVAKAIGQRLTDKTIYTRFHQVIGTPLYMSPEQAEVNALDVDTRSDVYALGVLLYELLTGTTPIPRERFETAAFDEIRRILREEEPRTPSTRLGTLGGRLSEVSLRRHTEPARLLAEVKGDLDWIVMKALEKDRTRRYDGAAGMARDVERFLADEEVEARPPSLGYRLGKFARRHRGPVTAAAALAVVLCLGLVGTWSGWLQARREADHAARAQREALSQRDQAEQAREAEQAARRNALDERDQAQSAREEARRALYRANLGLLQAAWDADNTSRVLELLEATRPGPGDADPRGFEWHYWAHLCRAEAGRVRLDFGPAPAQARGDFVALSASGNRCAALMFREPTAARPQVARVWDTADGREIATLPLDEAGAVRLTLSGDGRRLAVADESGGIVV